MLSHALSRMMRIAALLALAATAASCGTRQPAPDTRQWIVVGEEAGHRASVDPASIRRDTAAVRAVAYAVEYAQAQDPDGAAYDRQELSMELGRWTDIATVAGDPGAAAVCFIAVLRQRADATVSRAPQRHTDSLSYAFDTENRLKVKPKKQPLNQWTQIEWLVDGEGEINIGRVAGIRCAAVASDGHNALAMLVRRPEESLHALLTRLDEAIRLAVEEDEYTDEING